MLVVLDQEPQAAQEQEAPPVKEGDREEAERILERPVEE